ncbi:MAG: O-antigen ligase family protein [Campylobacter sp.]|nr:O-antigen ligase family protein [Campylobacter sp.]
MGANLKKYIGDSPQKGIFVFLISVWIISVPFKNAIYQLASSLLILYFLIYLAIYKNFAPLKNNLKNSKFLAIGFFLVVFSMVIANLLNPEFLAKKSWHITAMFIMRYALIFVILAYFYTLDFFGKKELVFAVFTSFFLLSFTAIYQILTNPAGMFNSHIGLTGSLAHHNAMGLSMGLAVSSAISLFAYKKKLSLAFTIYFLFFMIFSFSRSAWVASFAAGVCFIALNFKNFTLNDKKILLSFIVLLILVLIGLFVGFDSFKERLDMLLSGNSSNRYLIWKYSWDRILERPIFGWGIDTFRNLPNSVVHISSDFNSTHNLMLEILIYTGIFGFISALFAIAVCLKKLAKSSALLPLGVHFLVVTQFDFGAYTSKELLSYLTILIFLAYADGFKKGDKNDIDKSADLVQSHHEA